MWALRESSTVAIGQKSFKKGETEVSRISPKRPEKARKNPEKTQKSPENPGEKNEKTRKKPEKGPKRHEKARRDLGFTFC